MNERAKEGRASEQSLRAREEQRKREKERERETEEVADGRKM